MSEACLEQIKYWSGAIKEMNKAIRRKNKRINSLQKKNLMLEAKVSELMTRIAKIEVYKITKTRTLKFEKELLDS